MRSENTYPDFLSFYLHTLLKKGFQTDAFTVDQLRRLYDYHCAKKAKPENLRLFMIAARGLLGKTEIDQRTLSTLETEILTIYKQQKTHHRFLNAVSKTISQHPLLSLFIAILLVSLAFWSYRHRTCFVNKSLSEMVRCVTGSDSVTDHKTSLIQVKAENKAAIFYLKDKLDEATVYWQVSGLQTGYVYISERIGDTLSFQNPLTQQDSSNTEYQISLQLRKAQQIIWSDTLNYQFETTNTDSLEFNFVYPQPLPSQVDDLRTDPQKETDWNLLIGIMLIVLLVWYFMRAQGLLTDRVLTRNIKLKKQILSKEKNLNKLKGPYYLPLRDESHNTHQMYENTEIRDIVNELNRKRDLAQNKIDVKATLLTTIRNAGILKIIRKPAFSKPAYLLIIKTGNNRNHHFLFIQDILKFIQPFIDIEVFVYDYHINQLVSSRSNKLYTLNELHNHFHNYQLLLWGDGHDLIDHKHGDLNQSFRRDLEAWDHKILFTHIHPQRWAKPEQLLAQYFYIEKADIVGLLKSNTYYKYEFLEDIDTKIAALNKALQESVPFPDIQEFENKMSSLPEKEKDLAEFYIQRLSWYYTENEFQLIACCALYENLYWDVTKAMAISLFGKTFFTDELVARLCHLPWFISGKIPPIYRDILVKEIYPQHKKKALDRLKMIVTESTREYTDTFAHDQMKISLAKTYAANHIPINDEELVQYTPQPDDQQTETINIDKSYTVQKRRPWLIELIASSLMHSYKISIRQKPVTLIKEFRVETAYRFRQKAKSWMVLAPLTLLIFISLIPLVKKNSTSDPFTMNDQVYVCKNAKDSSRFYNRIADVTRQLNKDSAARYYDKAYTLFANDTSLINLFSLSPDLKQDLRNKYPFTDTNLREQLSAIAARFDDSSLYLKLLKLSAGFNFVAQGINDTTSLAISLGFLEEAKNTLGIYFEQQVTANKAFLEQYLQHFNGSRSARNRLNKLFSHPASTAATSFPLTIVYANEVQFATAVALKTELEKNDFLQITLRKEQQPHNSKEIVYFSQGVRFTVDRLSSILSGYTVRQLPQTAAQTDSMLIMIYPDTKPAKSLIFIHYNNHAIEPNLRSIKIAMNRGNRFQCDGYEYISNITQNEIRYYDDRFKDSIKYLQAYLDSSFTPNISFQRSKIPRNNSIASAEIWIDLPENKPCESFADHSKEYILYFEKDKIILSKDDKKVLDKLKRDIVEAQLSTLLEIACYCEYDASPAVNEKIARAYGTLVTEYLDKTFDGQKYKITVSTLAAALPPENCRGIVRITLGDMDKAAR